MKKTYVLNIFILLLLGTTMACKRFLVEDSRSQLSTESFFSNDKEAILAINGLYSLLHTDGLYRDVGLDRLNLYGSDEVGPNRAEDGINFNYTWDETTPYHYQTYKDLYEVARNCAVFLKAIEDNKNISEAIRNRSVGEALFIRALVFYNLTNIWGDVPYFRELPTVDELATITRTDKNVIRKDMKADLQKAFELLPASYTSSDLGRATKWAAATLKAKFHMMDKEWKDMRDESVKVITQSPHKLLTDFSEVFNQFDPKNQYNAEIIFAVDFTGPLGIDNKFSSSRVNWYTPRVGTDEPLDKTKLKAFQTALAARNENMRGYGKAIPLPALARKASWETGDLRYDKTIVTNYLGFDLTFPYFRKMWNLDQANSPRSNSSNNNVVFRLADVYLMAAEAENELNGPADAYQWVNEVRKRAFDPDKPWSGLNKESFRVKLRDERKFELCGEGQRRMDLIRWGILVETIKNTEQRSFNNPADNITERNNLYPINEEEILLNPNLLKTDPTNNGFR